VTSSRRTWRASSARQSPPLAAEIFDLVYETAIEENPELRSWRPRVNGAYPESAPYSMVSPNVLCNFPELPEELQYRFWGRDLLLWDYHANVIVDVLPDAIPST
jgi:hypothetical protein